MDSFKLGEELMRVSSVMDLMVMIIIYLSSGSYKFLGFLWNICGYLITGFKQFKS